MYIFRQVLFCLLLIQALLACKNEKTADTTAPKTAVSTETPTIGLEKSWVMSISSTGKLPAAGEGTPTQQRMFKAFYGGKDRIGFTWHFFPNGVMTEFQGQRYQEGKWSSPDGNKTIAIQLPSEKKEESVTIHYLGADSLLISLGDGKAARDYGFKNDGANYDNPEQNPFHPINNQWRIKPAAAESDEQLKARMKNHLKHLYLILDAALQHNMKVVSFRASPSCLHQYNGGVGLESEKNLSDQWYACFFDKNDAKKAAKIVETAMKTKKDVKAEAKNNWAQNNYLIIKSLHDAI